MNSKIKIIVKDALILLVVSTVFVTIVNKSFKGLKKEEIQDPVITSVMQENIDELKELLKENPSEKLKFQDSFGRNALMWAAYANLEDKKLHSEAEAKRLTMVNLFLSSGIDLNLRDKDGWSALMWASWSGLDAVVAKLIESGAEINFADKNGNTALILATMRGKESIVKTLLEKGADKNARSLAGKNALDFAKEMIDQHPKDKGTFEAILNILG